MNIFIKATACVLTALILWLCLYKHTKELSVLLTLGVCAIVLIAAISFIRPITEFISKIQKIANIDHDLLAIILKVVGIGMVAEFSSLICKDAGNESMGKALQILSSVVVLWISLPVFEKLFSLLDKILGAV